MNQNNIVYSQEIFMDVSKNHNRFTGESKVIKFEFYRHLDGICIFESVLLKIALDLSMISDFLHSICFITALCLETTLR